MGSWKRIERCYSRDHYRGLFREPWQNPNHMQSCRVPSFPDGTGTCVGRTDHCKGVESWLDRAVLLIWVVDFCSKNQPWENGTLLRTRIRTKAVSKMSHFSSPKG